MQIGKNRKNGQGQYIRYNGSNKVFLIPESLNINTNFNDWLDKKQILEEEKESAQKVLDEVNKKLNGKVVTVIRKEKNYCKAEEYHQKYFEKRSKR